MPRLSEQEVARMIRKTAATALGGMCLALVTASVAFAGSLPAANSGTISVYVPTTTLSSAGSQPRYQGSVAFNTTGASILKNPRVWVACYQNGAIVYGEGGSPTGTFKLGGDMSQWVLNGGGAANCAADLYYILNAKGTAEWNGKGAQGGNVYLAHTSFRASE
jgi:hypothetical protein